MQRTRPYVVRQGDYVAKIAAQLGCDGDDIWNDPRNASLIESGRTPDTLNPGDVLRVPESAARFCALDVQADNRYVGKLPSARVAILFRQDGAPIVGQRYEVLLFDEVIAQGKTGGDGRVEAVVPVSAREIDVVFPDAGLFYSVAVGHIDPVTERRGQIERLRQLGYLSEVSGPSRSVSEPALRGAIRRFQKDQRITETGLCDAATRDALVRAFGK